MFCAVIGSSIVQWCHRVRSPCHPPEHHLPHQSHRLLSWLRQAVLCHAHAATATATPHWLLASYWSSSSGPLSTTWNQPSSIPWFTTESGRNADLCTELALSEDSKLFHLGNLFVLILSFFGQYLSLSSRPLSETFFSGHRTEMQTDAWNLVGRFWVWKVMRTHFNFLCNFSLLFGPLFAVYLPFLWSK